MRLNLKQPTVGRVQTPLPPLNLASIMSLPFKSDPGNKAIPSLGSGYLVPKDSYTTEQVCVSLSLE